MRVCPASQNHRLILDVFSVSAHTWKRKEMRRSRMANDSASSRNDINDELAFFERGRVASSPFQRVHDAACLRARTRKRRV